MIMSAKHMTYYTPWQRTRSMKIADSIGHIFICHGDNSNDAVKGMVSKITVWDTNTNAWLRVSYILASLCVGGKGGIHLE